MHSTRPSGTRRRAPRLAIQLDGRIEGRVPRSATVIDLSVTGCLLRCPSLLDRGAILDLELSLPDGSFRAKVRVVESSVDGGAGGAPTAGDGETCLAGVEFLALPAAEDRRLRHFVDSERLRRKRADAPAG